MCIAIYLALIALSLYLSDALIREYALSVATDEGGWMVIALGWEIVPEMWPLVMVSMVVASALTLLVVRRVGRRGAPTET